MNFNRVKIGKQATVRLSMLKGRTGLTPNILCRFGLCLSLKNPIVPDPDFYDENGQEFNRYTLTGQWDSLIVGLVKERLLKDGLDPEHDFFKQFKAHLNRGAISLFDKIKNIEDIVDLFPSVNPIPELDE